MKDSISVGLLLAWYGISGCGVDPVEAACSLYGPHACEADPRCSSMQATPLQTAPDGADCYDRSVASEVVGCTSADSTCEDLSWVASAPDGTLFRFAGYCWPTDFEGVGVTDDFPACDDTS